MAEALNHAHERGVLHRDVKPSNVLVTSDAMPMLLDFNLAREVNLDAAAAEEAVPGGTLDYMAPEHIEEMIEGISDGVGVRSDIFGLGVLLFEAIMGERPYPPPRGAATAIELLHRAAQDRRAGAPRLRTRRPEVPGALEAVIRRCLLPDPSGRYASAADLAADLQAVADDRPLKHAHEPWPDRTVRWFRRHRRSIAALAPVVVATVLAAGLALNARDDRERLFAKVKRLYDDGAAAETSGDYARAAVLFNSAVKLVDRPDPANDLPNAQSPSSLWPTVTELRQQARTRQLLAERTYRFREVAEAFPALIEPLRFRLVGFGADLPAVSSEIQRVLLPFHVFEPGDWFNRPDIINDLDEPRRSRLVREVNELLFLWAVALVETREPETLTQAVRLCDKALEFASPPGPWHALRDQAVARLEDRVTTPAGPGSEITGSSDELSAVGCFEWGYLRFHDRKRESAQACLKKAVNLDPGNAWYRFCLGLVFEDPAGRNTTEPLRHYDAALALQPKSPWVRYSRARVYRSRGAWEWAIEDFQRALSDLHELPPQYRDRQFEARTRLELGLARQSLGDYAGAREEYDRVIASDGSGPFSRGARANQAKLDADSGDISAAVREYERLLVSDPADRSARFSLALIALRAGEPEQAERVLTELLSKVNYPDADAFAYRAVARLSLGRGEDALADADAAVRRSSSPNRERIRTRVRIALGRIGEIHPSRPEELLALPLNGRPLRRDLRSFADRLAQVGAFGERVDDPRILDALLTRAVVLSALGVGAAEQIASRAVMIAPESSRALLTRAWIRRHSGKVVGAREDLESARALDPNDVRVWELSGRLRLDVGDANEALAELSSAIHKGADGVTIRSTRARALIALNDPAAALIDWAAVLELDPDDPDAYLGRAETFLALKEWDQALADLEQAASWTEGRPGLSLRITWGFLRVVPSRPNLLPRVFTQLRSTLSSARSN